MMSEAVAPPPGLLIRNTMPVMEESAAIALSFSWNRATGFSPIDPRPPMLRLSNRPLTSTIAIRPPLPFPARTTTCESGEARLLVSSYVTIVVSTPRSPCMSIDPFIAMSPVISIVPCMKTFMGLWRQPMANSVRGKKARTMMRRMVGFQTCRKDSPLIYRLGRTQFSDSSRVCRCLRSGLRKCRNLPHFRRVSR